MQITKCKYEFVWLPEYVCSYMISNNIYRTSFSTIIPLEIWDVPGDITPETLEEPLSSFASIIFVIDILVRYIVAH